MSVYGPNQVEEIVIGTTDVAGKPAASGEVGTVKADGSFAAPAAGDSFYLLQGTGGAAAKGLDFEFTDVVDPAEIDSVTTSAYVAETAKIVNVTGFGTIQASALYEVFIRIYNDGGTLSPENFRHIAGTYVTSAVAEGTTTVIDGLAAALNASLADEGAGLFVVTKDATSITIAGQIQKVVPGKITGRPVEFDVEISVSNLGGVGENLGLLSQTETSAAYAGTGTGKQVVNKEWFTKGYKYEVYREASWPANFDTPYYADSTAGYSVINIKYKKARKYTSVENQYRVLTIYTVNPGKDLAGAAESNKILAKIVTAWGTAVTALPEV